VCQDSSEWEDNKFTQNFCEEIPLTANAWNIDEIEVDFRVISYEDETRMEVAQDRVQWWALL
jgi:hypothetical protein